MASYKFIKSMNEKYLDGSDYTARIWEDQSGSGKPIIVLNVPNKDLDEKLGQQIGRAVCDMQIWNPQEVSVYQQDRQGGMKVHKYLNERTEEESNVPDDISIHERAEAQKIMGNRKIIVYEYETVPVSSLDRDRLGYLTNGEALKQPDDITRQEPPDMKWDLNELDQEYQQLIAELGLKRTPTHED